MKTLGKQFFGKTTFITFIALTVVFFLSAIFRESAFAPIVLAFIGFVTIYAGAKNLSYGIFIAFAEMMAGGHGHLFAVNVGGFSLSLRMVIFGAVFLALFWHLFKNHFTFRLTPARDYPFIALFLAMVIGTLIGALNNPLSAVFDDANSYFAFSYIIPLIAVNWTSLSKRQFLHVFFASALWTAVFSLALSFTFTHLPLSISGDIYTFVRDSRMAEVTLQVPENARFALGEHAYWYRIFTPAQLYPLIFLFYLVIAGATYLRRENIKTEWYMIAALCFAALLLGASRSFLVGAIAGLAPIALYLFVKEHYSLRDGIKFSIRGIAVIGLAGLFAWGSVVFPIPERPNIFDAAFYKTSAETERSVAVVSRWALLTPMNEKITESPITGRGFGTTVTYKSEDPRIIAETGGIYETYRFEWGYQDIWLKMGILGLIAFAWILWSILKAGWFTLNAYSQRGLVLTLLAGILALFATHTFSPYLNHPIGIAFILFVLPFLDYSQSQQSESVPKPKKERAAMRVPNPVLTSERE